jgi:hypothetical protein
MRPFRVEFVHKIIEAGLLRQAIRASRAGCFFLQGQVHAFMPAVLLRMPRLMRSIAMPSLSQKTESVERL